MTAIDIVLQRCVEHATRALVSLDRDEVDTADGDIKDLLKLLELLQAFQRGAP